MELNRIFETELYKVRFLFVSNIFVCVPNHQNKLLQQMLRYRAVVRGGGGQADVVLNRELGGVELSDYNYHAGEKNHAPWPSKGSIWPILNTFVLRYLSKSGPCTVREDS